MHLLDYVETEFRTFDEVPLGPVDSAVISQLSMLRVECLAPSRQVSPRELLLAERFGELLGACLEPDLLKRLLFAVSASPRFRDLSIDDVRSMFDAERETQFAAMTFSWKNGKERRFSYIAFRGTDTSLTGWNEDFNMGWMWPVPGQAEAVRYLEECAASHDGPLFVGGHSKGGNLAVYATAKAKRDTLGRIRRTYNHDGPGFRTEAVSVHELDRVAEIVHKTVPRESIVGMLLETHDNLHVVESRGHGVDQHSLFNWEIDSETRDFVYAEKLADSSMFWRGAMREWVEKSTLAELEETVDALFRALESSGEADVKTILAGGPKTVGALLETARSLDEHDRSVLRRAFGSFGNAVARTIGGTRAERRDGR